MEPLAQHVHLAARPSARTGIGDLQGRLQGLRVVAHPQQVEQRVAPGALRGGGLGRAGRRRRGAVAARAAPAAEHRLQARPRRSGRPVRRGPAAEPRCELRLERAGTIAEVGIRQGLQRCVRSAEKQRAVHRAAASQHHRLWPGPLWLAFGHEAQRQQQRLAVVAELQRPEQAEGGHGTPTLRQGGIPLRGPAARAGRARPPGEGAVQGRDRTQHHRQDLHELAHLAAELSLRQECGGIAGLPHLLLRQQARALGRHAQQKEHRPPVVARAEDLREHAIGRGALVRQPGRHGPAA
mmetsp:Transcript_62462/g.193456  ORF Transcript_62462/g.193456 Transcript_62462/m.193456 type:complete len:295 (-) Transcript_62462:535-1419(-)